MNQDLSASRSDPAKPPTYQSQQPSNSINTNTNPSLHRVRVYDRPNQSLVQKSSTLGMILLLIALSVIVYFLVFTS